MLTDIDPVSAGNLRLHVPKTSEIVADQIRGQIVRGELREGDSLPLEAQLIEALGVSRPTLREAFRILEAEGLLSVVRGSRSGAKINRPSAELVSRYAGYVLESQGTTIAELYQSRLAIEPTVVRWLATVKGETVGMPDLKKVLGVLSDFMESGKHDEFIDRVELFHHALVSASGNRTLIFLNRMLLNLARKHQKEFQQRNPRSEADRRKSMRVGFASFEKLVALIEQGAVEEAVAHWRLHLQRAEETWTGSGEGLRVVNSLD